VSAGRRRIPDELKVLRGTAEKRRLNPDQPKLRTGRPPVVGALSKRARRIFRELIRATEALGYLTPDHRRIYALLASRLAEWEELEELLAEEGRFYETRTGLKKVHPAVAARDAAMRDARQLLTEVGLTPAARGKVKVAKQQHEGTGWDQLLRKV